MCTVSPPSPLALSVGGRGATKNDIAATSSPPSRPLLLLLENGNSSFLSLHVAWRFSTFFGRRRGGTIHRHWSKLRVKSLLIVTKVWKLKMKIENYCQSISLLVVVVALFLSFLGAFGAVGTLWSCPLRYLRAQFTGGGGSRRK